MQRNKQTRHSFVLRFRRFSGKSFSAFHSIHKVCNIGVLSGITLATIALSNTAEAQEQHKHKIRPSELEQELDEVTISASKIATPLAQATRQVTIISQREIVSASVRSLQDLLIYSAGIDVQQRGGHGVQADISIRGGSFDQNAILLNGVNLSNAQTGHLSYDIPINLSDIERIEIVHGASGLIYGSAAFSGGINIITKKDAHERLYKLITYGEHRTHHLEGRASWATKHSTHSLSISHKASDGYTENTDYKLLNLLGQSNFYLNKHNKLYINIGFNDKAYGANAFYSPKGPKQYEESNNFFVSFKGELGTDRLRIVPIVYWMRTHDEYHWERGKPLNHHRTDNIGANLALSYRSILGTSSLSLELRREDILGNKLGHSIEKKQGKYDKYASRINSSLSLEHTLLIGSSLTASVGAMINHNTQRRGKYEFLPSLSLSYRPNFSWNISGTWSQSVRIPTFVDLYYIGPRQQGNNKLQAERSQSLDLTTKYRQQAFDSYLTLFALWGKDIIDWVKLQATDSKYQSFNHGYINTYGLETGIRLRLGELIPELGAKSQLRIDYSHIRQKHDSQGLLSLYTMRYLRNKLTARLDYELSDRLSSTYQLRWQKRMGQFEQGTDSDGNTLYQDYPSYATIDVRFDYKLSPKVELSLQLNNLSNSKYFDFSAVHQPGFWANVALIYRLNR